MSSSMPALQEIGFKPGPDKNTGINLGTGDFSSYHPEQVVSVINSASMRIHESSVLTDASGVERLIPEAQQRLDTLMGVVDGFRAHVNNPANYEPGAKDKVVARYKAADEATEDTNMLTQVRERVAQFPEEPQVVSDLDGTLTYLTDMHGHILKRLPGSFIAERLLDERGREAFGQVFTTTWQPLLQEAPLIFEAAADEVEVRPGVSEFFSGTKDAGIKTTVLSANFLPFVQGVLSKVPEAKGTDVIAVTQDDLRATEKAEVLQHYAQINPDKPLIYIGDGTSDISAIAASDIVACYFALEGSRFSAELTERDIPHLTYRDFNDVSEAMAQIYPAMKPSYTGK